MPESFTYGLSVRWGSLRVDRIPVIRAMHIAIGGWIPLAMAATNKFSNDAPDRAAAEEFAAARAALVREIEFESRNDLKSGFLPAKVAKLIERFSLELGTQEPEN